MTTVKLSAPFKLKDVEVTELELDFDKLTGNDLARAEKEVRSMGDTTPMLDFSFTYQASIAAKIIGCPVDDILAMKAKDFTHVRLAVADFLMN